MTDSVIKSIRLIRESEFLKLKREFWKKGRSICHYEYSLINIGAQFYLNNCSKNSISVLNTRASK